MSGGRYRSSGSGFGDGACTSSGGRGRGRGRSGGGGGGGARGRGGRGRGRGGGRGGRGRGGYDWTKHLPPDHPMRRGLGPDPRRSNNDSRRRSENASASADAASISQLQAQYGRPHTDDEGSRLVQSQTEAELIVSEYTAYYERRDARRRERSERNRIEFDRVTAHAEEERRKREAQGHETATTHEADENGGAAARAARRAVEAMSSEEKEAALARHEERQAIAKYALDLEPERLHLGPSIRKELQKAVDDLAMARDIARNSARTAKKSRSSVGGSIQYGAPYFSTPRSDDGADAEAYKGVVADRIQSQAYQSMLRQRARLPAYQMSKTIADILLSPKVSTVVVSGETGSGKTTQVPRILVETAAERDMGRLNVLVAQPRRIAAVGVAERVAEEGGTGSAPGEPGCDVGYHIRHERRVGDDASVVFATTGIVLRILAGDPMLTGVDVVIVDEVHERSSDGDFLVTVLRDLATSKERGPGSERPLKLVLMSATVDADFFTNYLKDAHNSACVSKFNAIPVIHVAGVAHPVRDFYLEDAIDACVEALESSDSLFELDHGRHGGGGRGKKLGPRSSSGCAGYGKNSGQSEGSDEKHVRAKRTEYIAERFDEVTAALVADFDLKAKISEKESHLKSVSSGELPLGLAYHLVFYLDRLHRRIDNGDGAILVFLPGYDDISKLSDAFKVARNGVYADEASYLHVLCLHGSMPTSEQREVFRKPPGGKRKVVLSTNVAESSITIDDVVYCLDLGKHKEKTYDPQSHIECLLPTWISKASARQRRGRAGRVRAGECWHLYPSYYVKEGQGIDQASDVNNVPGGDNDPRPAFDGDVKFKAFALPEMLRTPLEDVCLRARFLDLAPRGAGGVERFLSQCPSPPGPLSLHNAMEALGPSDMMLLTSDTEELTPMGKLSHRFRYRHDLGWL